MVSLIIAIGATHLLHGVAAAVQHRNEVQVSWVPLTWSAYLFLLIAAHWWSLWDMRDAAWTFPAFFFVLLPPTLLYLTVSLLVGSLTASGSGSMLADFKDLRVPFFVLMTAANALTIWDGAILGVEPVWNSLRALQMVVLALMITGLASSQWRVQQLVAVLSLVTLVVVAFVLRFLPGAFAPG